jgi:hypothetical protein
MARLLQEKEKTKTASRQGDSGEVRSFKRMMNSLTGNTVHRVVLVREQRAPKMVLERRFWAVLVHVGHSVL